MGRGTGAAGGFAWLFGVLMLVVASAQGAAAQAPTDNAGAPVTPPPEVHQLMELMQSPAVKEWMNSKQAQTNDAAAESPNQMSILSNLINHVRRHVTWVAGAAEGLPDEADAAAGRFEADIGGDGSAAPLWKLLIFVACGPMAEVSFRSLSKLRGRSSRGDQAPRNAVHTLFRRLVPPTIFAIATLIPLLAFSFPPLTQALAIAIAIASITSRFVLALGKLLVLLITLPVGGDGKRPRPKVVYFWFRRAAVFIVYFAAGWAFLQILPPLGFSKASLLSVAYFLGIGLLMIAIEAICSRPAQEGARRSSAVTWLLSFYCMLLWGLWVAGFNWLLWLGIYALILPYVLSVATYAVRALHRAEAGFLARRPIAAVLLDRGVRAAIITVAALWMGYILGLGAATMMTPQTPLSHLLRGIIGGIVVLLAADFVWHVIKTGIDVKLSESPLTGDIGDEERARRARIQTLLPIFRNISGVVIAIIAGMMVLSGMGIEIGPLIAGAGIVGVAVGFGAQTVVKDVISGIFYLWDDAFRIGEYIESGNHKGVVEAFSLRSVKLRHHRGPLTTVPFGSLGAVRNLNRDWTIDKITLRVPYETDLVLMKKLIKQIGQQLLEDPDFGPNIIETLKMKGVEDFGEFAIVVRLSMMTKPGTQFVIRRTALALIRNAFRDNGIAFAVPTVQVAGAEHRDADALSVAARFAAESGARGETAA
ncbi:mechanosensitive ion channel family protein [Oryzifoliimicrobium ureilyticus]|uniref:mechanosensitive ion channel family protein n=1 Tax=Oryzifoliimicrobium ureilyticus TaxID=3113724 RepID=UPI0030761BF7